MEIRIIKSDDYGCGFNQLLTEFCRMPINISLESFVEKLKNPIAVYAGVFTDSKSLCDASAPEGFSKSLCDASAPEGFSKSDHSRKKSQIPSGIRISLREILD